MRQAGLDVVFLSTRANFAWLTAGGVNHVNTATADGVTTLAEAILRMKAEHPETQGPVST